MSREYPRLLARTTRKTRCVPTSGRRLGNPGQGKFRGSTTRWRKRGCSPTPPTLRPSLVKSNLSALFPSARKPATSVDVVDLETLSPPFLLLLPSLIRVSSRFEAVGNYRGGLKRGGAPLRKFNVAVTRRLAAAIKRNRLYHG